MSILDEEDILMERAEHNVKVATYTPEFDKRSWDEFQTEAIEPIVKKLAAHKRVGKFAVGVYVPTEPLFHWGVASSIYSMCRAYRLRCFHINGRNIHQLSDALALLVDISQYPYSMVVVEDFDMIPHSPVKSYIERALIGTWERETILPRSCYGVVFTTTQGDGQKLPEKLKRVKRLTWWGNIRRYKVE